MKKSLNAWKKIAARFVKNKKPSETLEMALIKAKNVQSLRSKRPLKSLRSKRPLKSLRSKRPAQSKRLLQKAKTRMHKKTRRMH
jgi:hypothetical protein